MKKEGSSCKEETTTKKDKRRGPTNQVEVKVFRTPLKTSGSRDSQNIGRGENKHNLGKGGSWGKKTKENSWTLFNNKKKRGKPKPKNKRGGKRGWDKTKWAGWRVRYQGDHTLQKKKKTRGKEREKEVGPTKKPQGGGGGQKSLAKQLVGEGHRKGGGGLEK